MLLACWAKSWTAGASWGRVWDPAGSPTVARGGTSTKVFARDPQPRAAGNQDRELGTGEEQVAQEWGGGEGLFEVVDEQEEAGITQRGRERIAQRAGSDLDHADGPGEHGRHRLGGGGRGNRRPGDLMVEGGGAGGRDSQGEAGLADPTGADQGDETGLVPIEQGGDRGDVSVPPDQSREWCRWGNQAEPTAVEWDWCDRLGRLDPLAAQTRSGRHEDVPNDGRTVQSPPVYGQAKSSDVWRGTWSCGDGTMVLK